MTNKVIHRGQSGRGLGGYFPPPVMGAVYQATGSYMVGLLPVLTALLVGLFARKAFGRTVPVTEPRLLLANEPCRAGILPEAEEPARRPA